jgi:hypothetical protein
MTSPIANALVTVIPNVSGLPTLSGYTNSDGQITFSLYATVSYKVKFSGPAIGNTTISPASTTLTFHALKNKGTLGISVSGQTLSAGKSVFAYQGDIPIVAHIPSGKKFSKWSPSSLVKASLSEQTTLVMPTASTSLSAILKSIPPMLYVVDGYNAGALATNDAYDISTNTWTAKASDTIARYHLAAGVIGSKLYAVDGTDGSALNHAYDPSTNTWSTKASDLKARNAPTAGVVG